MTRIFYRGLMALTLCSPTLLNVAQADAAGDDYSMTDWSQYGLNSQQQSQPLVLQPVLTLAAQDSGNTPQHRPSWQLAAASTSSVSMTPQSSLTEAPATTHEESWLTANKTHQYLGLGAVAAGIITALAPKEVGGLHETAAKASALMALGAVGTGVAYHWDDINSSNGLDDPDNMHALLAGLGALGIAMAASEGPKQGHQGYGILGLTGMMVGIRYVW